MVKIDGNLIDWPCHEIVLLNQIPSVDPSMCETSWDKERHKTDEP